MAPNYNFARARANVEALIDYTFRNADLLREALHTDGPILIGGTTHTDNNDVLALVGDSVLDLVVHLSSWETQLSKDDRKKLIASNPNLGKVGRGERLHEQLNLSAGLPLKQISDRMIATALEAVLGAVYIDSGNMDTVKAVVVTLGLM